MFMHQPTNLGPRRRTRSNILFTNNDKEKKQQLEEFPIKKNETGR